MTGAARFRTIIVDDEPLARAGLAHLLASDREIEVVGQCASGTDAVSQIRELAPDLVLLDIQLPDMSGFDVVRLLGDSMPAVLFLTAHDSFAVDAFEIGAADYVLKPFDTARLEKALERAKARVRAGHRRRRPRACGRGMRDAGAPRRRVGRHGATGGRSRRCAQRRSRRLPAAR